MCPPTRVYHSFLELVYLPHYLVLQLKPVQLTPFLILQPLHKQIEFYRPHFLRL